MCTCGWYDLSMRPATVTEESQDWIVNLPADSWFKASSVPGPRAAVHTMLHRMLAEPQPIIGRAARGVYWRQHSPEHILYGVMPSTPVAVVVAPAGSGWSDWSALAAFRWTTQRPVQQSVAVPVRGLTPPAMPHRGVTPIYVFRPNRRRLALNWGEATLLDAGRSFGGSDCLSWHHAMQNLTATTSETLAGTVIEKDKVLWAAETERFVPRWPAGEGPQSFASVIARLQTDMPDRIPA